MFVEIFIKTCQNNFYFIETKILVLKKEKKPFVT